MGKVKLTLTVEEQIVTNAKRQARHNQQSLSEMIEQLLVTAHTNTSENNLAAEPKALRLRGLAKSSLSTKTDKQIRDIMHKDRFGL